MITDFSRKITLLRKERGLSQKKVAADLNVAQALLSHYEKGKRECGLDFLVNISKYYNVSSDFLLGLSPVPSGLKIDNKDILDVNEWDRSKFGMSDLSYQLNKSLLSNSLDIIFTLLIKTKNTTFIKSVSSYLNLSVYKSFRLLFNYNSKNDNNMFNVENEGSSEIINAGLSLSERKAIISSNISDIESQTITNASLQEEFPKSYLALMNLINNCEVDLSKIKNI